MQYVNEKSGVQICIYDDPNFEEEKIYTYLPRQADTGGRTTELLQYDWSRSSSEVAKFMGICYDYASILMHKLHIFLNTSNII